MRAKDPNSSHRPKKVFASIDETCGATGLGRTTIYQLINDKVLESVKIGKRRLVVVESIEAMANSTEAAAKS